MGFTSPKVGWLNGHCFRGILKQKAGWLVTVGYEAIIIPGPKSFYITYTARNSSAIPTCTDAADSAKYINIYTLYI